MKRRRRAVSLADERAQFIDRIARQPLGVGAEDRAAEDEAVDAVRVLADRGEAPAAAPTGGTPSHDAPPTSPERIAPRARDVDAFERRAPSYERGVLGALHREIADRTAALVLGSGAAPKRILDVGCGTGYLLRLLAARCPAAIELAGVDPAPAMIDFANAAAADERLGFAAGVSAEQLPFGAENFDVVIATTSFDHWSNQRAGVLECSRVLTPDGCLVLVDQFSNVLAPTLVVGRRGKARTKHRATRLLREAGFESVEWRSIHRPLIRAAVARR